jgi:hypothetical protein
MTTKWRICLIVGVTAAVAVGTGMLTRGTAGTAPDTSTRSAPPPAPSPQPVARSGDSIRVDRKLVRTTEEVIERPRPRDRVQSRPTSTAAPPPQVSRVRRVLFGSGRYRPAPFPRVSQEDSSPR